MNLRSAWRLLRLASARLLGASATRLSGSSINKYSDFAEVLAIPGRPPRGQRMSSAGLAVVSSGITQPYHLSGLLNLSQ